MKRKRGRGRDVLTAAAPSVDDDALEQSLVLQAADVLAGPVPAQEAHALAVGSVTVDVNVYPNATGCSSPLHDVDLGNLKLYYDQSDGVRHTGTMTTPCD